MRLIKKVSTFFITIAIGIISIYTGKTYADTKIIICPGTGVKYEAEWNGVKIASQKDKGEATMIVDFNHLINL